MNVDEFGTARIHYQYRNKPKDNAPESMHIHEGSASAKLEDEGVLQTEYYSGRTFLKKQLVNYLLTSKV